MTPEKVLYELLVKQVLGDDSCLMHPGSELKSRLSRGSNRQKLSLETQSHCNVSKSLIPTD